jgi:predicted transcriptional regulator
VNGPCERKGVDVAKKLTEGHAALYLEIPQALRERLDDFVTRNRRKLKGEVCNAIEQYLDRQEGAQGEPRRGRKGAEG